MKKICVLTLDPITLEPCESRYSDIYTYGYEEIEWEKTTYVNGVITTKKGTVKIPRIAPDFDVYIDEEHSLYGINNNTYN